MRQIFEKIAEQIAYNTKDVAAMLTMIAGFMYGKFMLTTDRSPALLIILAILIFYLPLFFAVIYLLLLIPKLVCIVILQVVYARDRKNDFYSGSQNNTNYNNHDYTGHSGYNDGTSYNNYNNEWSSQHQNTGYESWQQDWKQTYEQYQSQKDTNQKYNQQYNQYNSHDSQQNKTSQRKDELSEALSFYGLTIPFTEEQLRDKRRKLMKTAHPDEGGNTEAAADINRYFDILKKFAN